MNKVDFERYLEDRYNNQMNWYAQKARHNKKMHTYMQTLVIIFSVITPTLVVIGEGWLRWFAVVSSGIVAIVATLLKTFKYQENWINYRTTRETLKKEIHYYKAKLFGYEEAEDPEALFVKRVEAVISRENTYWIYVQKAKEEKIEKRS